MAKAKTQHRTRQGDADKALVDFLPAVRRWFVKTFDAPSPAQLKAWPVIRRGDNTLLLAPTGSGKTLAAFMCAIDDLYRQSLAGELADGVNVLYVTPLKALGNDIHKNLMLPLAGIGKQARGKLAEAPAIRVAVRTGDTPQAERQRMIRRPPHILITTPESLYLMLGSMHMAPKLRSVRTVIVDEVHSLCDNKRGVHLSISLERLNELADRPIQRVGCSATLRPLDQIAAFLVGGNDAGRPRPCTIVDAGMRKDLDVTVMAPVRDFLEASNQAMWSSAYELLLSEIGEHATTLVFCNSRYKAERTSLRMGDLLANRAEQDSDNTPRAPHIGVHHGSMSRESRLEAEDDLKSGRLDALIATSSLELGIDIGSVDLVYQLESVKSVATGLQRIGRAGHLLDHTSKGRVLVFDRDDLLEAAAVARAMVRGQIDAIEIPRNCLDVLAQQIVGIVATGATDADTVFALIRRAYPYAELKREQFDAVLAMVAGEHGFEMARPPFALVLWDRTSGRLALARGATQASAMGVGTIAETSEYDVVIQGSNKRVGKVQSEFVDDALHIDDVFVLGSSAWRLAGFDRNRLMVTEAPGTTPTVPWWQGPIAPRTSELGQHVGELRRQITRRLNDPNLPTYLRREYHVCPDAASAMIDYVREQQAAIGVVPDDEQLLVETWRDELGRTNHIIHSPYSARINRTWGMALTAQAKKQFKQEWSVTTSNDLILLTLSEQAERRTGHTDVDRFLTSVTATTVRGLAAAGAAGAVSSVSTFREAAVCALQISRARQGRRVPLWLQNYFARELYEAAQGCETYPVFDEVRRSYLEQALDVAGTEQLLGQIDQGRVTLLLREVESPSPFAHSLLIEDMRSGDRQMGRERRANLLRLHRRVLQEVLSAEQMADLLDARAIERLERRALCRSEASRARSADELAQAIRNLGDIPAHLDAVAEIVAGDAVPMLRQLVDQARVVAIELLEGDAQSTIRLVTADRWREYHDAFTGAGRRKLTVLLPQFTDDGIGSFQLAPAAEVIPARWRRKQAQARARLTIIERHLRCRGPVTVYELVNHTGWPIGTVEQLLDHLVDQGTVARGVYTGDKPQPQWVNRANLEEIHRLTLGYLKRELAACAPYEVVDFMTRWQHRHPDTRLKGINGLRQVIGQLQGFEILQGVLEREVLSARVADYAPEMLERLIASGEVCWCRVHPSQIKRVMLTLCFRKDMSWLAAGAPVELDAVALADIDITDEIVAVRDYFQQHRTAFFDDVVQDTALDAGAVERAVWHLAWCGQLTCDTYECLRHADFRATVSACYDLATTPRNILNPNSGALGWNMSTEVVIDRLRKRRMDARLGRWSTTERLTPGKKPPSAKQVTRRWAQQLLERWGILTRDVVDGEAASPRWGDLLPELKRLEMLGEVRRGYFIEHHQGEQYGLPDAIELLRDCRARRDQGQSLGYLPDEPLMGITSRDPANLYAANLDIVREDGQPMKRTQRAGNTCHQYVLQAGQVLIFQDRQVAALTHDQLKRCLDRLVQDGAAQERKLVFQNWNGYPIKVSPVAPVLAGLGFALTGQGNMVWPPPRQSRHVHAPADPQELYLPYYLEPPPVQYGREWTLGIVTDAMRPTMCELLDLFEAMLPKRGWEMRWHSRGLEPVYRDSARMHVQLGRRHINLRVGAPAAIDADGNRRGMFPWHSQHMLRIMSTQDMNKAFHQQLVQLLDQAEDLTDLHLSQRDDSRPAAGR